MKPFSKDNFYFIAWIFLITVLLIISQLLLYSKGFYSISADEAGHTLEAFLWYKGNTSLLSIWLPFLKILNGSVFNIYYDLIWTPRILSSFFGLLTVFSLIFLTQELFQNKVISILAGFLGSTFSCLVIFSVIPMTEIYFFFFTVSSVAFLFHWKRTKSHLSLIFLIILSNLGEATRYEAWVFSLIIFFVIITEQTLISGILSKKIFRISVIFISLFAFPIFWVILSYQATGELAAFLNSVTKRYSVKTEKWGILSEIKNNVLYYFFLIDLLSLNILGFLNLLYFSKKDIKIRLYAFIFLTTLLFMGFITFSTKAMPTHNAWRLTSIWSIMLLPFTAQWLYILLSDKRLYLRANFILFIIIILYYFNMQTVELTKSSYMSKEDLRIGNYIGNLGIENQNSKIYIERREWHFTSLLIGSQHPDRFIVEGSYDFTINSDSIRFGQVRKFIASKVEYLVLAYRGKLKFDSDHVEEIKAFDNWQIYKIE